MIRLILFPTTIIFLLSFYGCTQIPMSDYQPPELKNYKFDHFHYGESEIIFFSCDNKLIYLIEASPAIKIGGIVINGNMMKGSCAISGIFYLEDNGKVLFNSSITEGYLNSIHIDGERIDLAEGADVQYFANSTVEQNPIESVRIIGKHRGNRKLIRSTMN